MIPVFIYTLNDPVTGIVRYCGQTTDPDTRLSRHISNARKEKYHCPCWVKSLLSKKLRPVMEILDVVPNDEADFWEREYIQNFRERGFDLTNGTPGGSSGPGVLSPFFGKKHSLESRTKIRNSNLGQKRSTETCAKIGATKLGKKSSPETRAKLSDATRGEKNPNFGKKHSPETRDKIRAAQFHYQALKRSSGKLPGNCKISIGVF